MKVLSPSHLAQAAIVAGMIAGGYVYLGDGRMAAYIGAPGPDPMVAEAPRPAPPATVEFDLAGNPVQPPAN